MNPAQPLPMSSSKTRGAAWLTGCIILVVIGLLAALIIPTVGTTCGRFGHTVYGSNLRQIGQAGLIYAQAHNDKLPEATNLHDYMVMLAQDGGLNSISPWLVKTDPAIHGNYPEDGSILPADGDTRPPQFADMPIAVSVVLSGLTTNAPATTPIAWTRGLQADGTWSKDSPFEGEGGYILFFGGNVAWHKSLQNGMLPRHDGTGTTSNILEALPPGSRIGEWQPTAR